MKKIIFLLLALLLLGGGGFCAWGWFAKKQDPMTAFKVQILGEKDPAAAPAKKKKKAPPKMKYVELPSITISIVREGVITRIFSANITLEVKGAAHEKVVTSYIPQLKDRYFSVLYSLGALPAHLDITRSDIVKQRLQQAADEVVGKGLVRAVLIQSTSERRV